MIRKIRLVLTIVVIAFPMLVLAQAAAHPEMVVSTDWLAQHLNDPKVVVLHVGSKQDYDAGHIPGARLLSTSDFIDSASDLQTELPDYIGHGGRTSLLDGSLNRWRAEKREISTTSVSATKGSLTLRVHPEVRELLEAVKKVSQSDGSTMLVDSRPERRYKDGHIAGAAHVFWEETTVNGTKDPTLLPPDKLRALFASHGIKPGEKLVTYCEVGLQASHLYFIAKYLGYNASMFDGSIHQWSHMEMLPLVPGTSPRCAGGGNSCEIHEKM